MKITQKFGDMYNTSKPVSVWSEGFVIVSGLSPLSILAAHNALSGCSLISPILKMEFAI